MVKQKRDEEQLADTSLQMLSAIISHDGIADIRSTVNRAFTATAEYLDKLHRELVSLQDTLKEFNEEMEKEA